MYTLQKKMLQKNKVITYCSWVKIILIVADNAPSTNGVISDKELNKKF